MKRTLILLLATISYAVDSEKNGFINANNLFATDLYSQIAKSSTKDFIVSPLSVEVVLSLAQSGCRDETAQEIKNTLHLPADLEEIKSGVKQLHFNTTDNSPYTLVSANKIYVMEDYAIKEEFRNFATEVYKAQVENTDFGKNVEAAQTINKWVETETHDKIHNLIDPSDLDELTRLVLINVLYFKGNWSVQFRPSDTKKEDFYKLDKTIMTVDMMHHFRKKFLYYESNDLNAKFLELPFQGGDVSMVIALPNEKDGIFALENQIDHIFDQHMRKELVYVGLPKFKIESTIKLKDVLKKLGINKAFKKNEADLSGISGKKGELVINDIFQKVFIDIDEKGGEAAATSYVRIGHLRSSLGTYQPEPKYFIVDHPFIFYVKIKNVVVFTGRVLEPISGFKLKI